MDTLPIEVMTYILDLLPLNYRQNMAMMNKAWYYASLHPILLRREFLVYNGAIHDTYDAFTNALLNTEKKLLKLKLSNVAFDLTIFENLGDRIISLHVTDLPVVDDVYLDAITGYCKNLEELEFYNITFKTCKPCTPIPKLRSITLKHVLNLSDLEFNQFVQCAPNVIKFSLIDCCVVYWPLSIRRFYPHNKITEYNSKNVFTSTNIVNYLKNSKSIKKLNPHNFFQIFSLLPEYIKLDSLSLSLEYYYKDKKAVLEEFKFKLAKHTSLKKIVISCIPCCFLSAVSKLHNLNYIELSYTTKILSNCFNEPTCLQNFFDSLENMKNLKTLIITRTKLNPQLNLTHTIPECTLKSLKLLSSPIENALSVINLGKNLESLHIQTSQKVILQTDDFLLLFSELTNLRHLKIDDCSELTDAILLSSPVSNIKGLKSLYLFDTRLTHRILRHFELLHLEHLLITDLSLRCNKPEHNIDSIRVLDFNESIKQLENSGFCSQTDLLDFKESMKQLGDSAPVLTTLELYIPIDEGIVLRNNKFNNDIIRDSLTNPNAYLDYFKSLKIFELGI